MGRAAGATAVVTSRADPQPLSTRERVQPAIVELLGAVHGFFGISMVCGYWELTTKQDYQP